MISSFREPWLEAFYLGDKLDRRIPADLARRLFRKLQMIDDSTTDQDLRVPLSNHFEKLQAFFAVGTRSGSTINGVSFFDGMARRVRRQRFT
jgi:hypothetical protein